MPVYNYDAKPVIVPPLVGGILSRVGVLRAAINLLVGALAFGVYTPTLSNVANLDGSTAFQCLYLRLGNMVIVAGKLNANPTAGVAVQLGISLPITSNIGAAEDVGGVAFAPAVANQGAAIVGDATNNRAEMQWIAVDLSNAAMQFIFMYRIL